MAKRWVFSSFVVVVVACLFGIIGVAQQAPDNLVGVWKTNFAKSTYSPGPSPTLRSQTSTWESLGGGQYRNVIDGVDAKGQAVQRLEVTLKFDGKDYEYKGTAQPTTRSYKPIDAHTFDYVQKVNGKVATTTRSIVSPDGKTRTLTTTGTNAEGKPIKNIVLWDKQ